MSMWNLRHSESICISTRIQIYRIKIMDYFNIKRFINTKAGSRLSCDRSVTVKGQMRIIDQLMILDVSSSDSMIDIVFAIFYFHYDGCIISPACNRIVLYDHISDFRLRCLFKVPFFRIFDKILTSGACVVLIVKRRWPY